MHKLSKGQQAALDEMINIHPVFILKGYAGTGKSYLISEFIRLMKSSHNVIVTAPTHKAVGVINGSGTIHAYLGLRLVEKQDRLELFATNKSQCHFGDVVIVDEASMVSKKLMKFILDAQKMWGLKITFVGDPGQIPPVKEKDSPVWNLKAPTYTLTEILRQAKDNPIIQLSQEVRKSGGTVTSIKKFTDGARILSGSRKEAKEFFKDNVTSTGFPQILAHKNTVVDKLNSWGRNTVYKNPPEPYSVGERLYVRSTSKTSGYKLEEIVRVLKVNSARKHPIKLTNKVKVVSLEVRSETSGVIKTVLTPYGDDDAVGFEFNKNILVAKARKTNIWGPFWQYSNSVTHLKHIYAMTCHRSQGSTYKDTIVDFTDINDRKLLYTAVTRASDRIFIII